MAMDPEVKALTACIRELDKLETAAARNRIASFVFARYVLGGTTDDDPIERMWNSKKLRHALLRAFNDMPLGPIGEPGCGCYVDERGLRSADCSIHGDEQDRRAQAIGVAGASPPSADDSGPVGAAQARQTSLLPPEPVDGFCSLCGQELRDDGRCGDCSDGDDELTLTRPVEDIDDDEEVVL